MARSGSSVGTVVRWDESAGGAVIEVTDPREECWADAAVVAGGPLRAGQVVTVEWTEPGAHGRPLRAVQVRLRDDLQATPGG
jgi:MOSC domain-containing protein YiiM